MQLWRLVVGSIAAAAMAASSAAQTPVLSSLSAPYAALQNTQAIHLAGNSYVAGQVAYGPVGTPLILSGSNLGGDGAVWFVPYKNGAIDENAVSVQATVSLWTPTSLILSVPDGAHSGLVFVATGGKSSNGLPFMVMPGAYSGRCPVVPVSTQLQIQTASLPDGAVSQAYSATLNAIGGSNSYTWSLVSGSLPAGLTMSSSGNNGIISGTPTTAGGPISITVQVADTSAPQQHDAATLSIDVTAQTEAISSAALYSFSIVNASGGSSYDAVGNVTAYTDSVNGTWSFNYDTLNRLATASGNQTDDPFPNFCWSYDSFGNRTDQMSASTVFPTGQGGANGCSTTGALGQNVVATYNVSNTNRMDSTTQNPSQGSYYDPSGNIKNDGVNQYLYDGEGRICALDLQIPGVAPTQYIYDADGNRVAKGTISTWSCDTTVNGFIPQSAYVLGPGGEQLTEMTYTGSAWKWAHTNVAASGLSATYDADLTGNTAGSLYFHLSDWLGTRRQQTDYAGNPLLDFIGLPFGDGLAAIPVSNTDVADATEYHFTGKERDTESGNDYFGARYYASTMGRFMSPDPSQLYFADPTNPQSLNLYSYGWNNPLTNIDPTGLDCVKDNGDGTATTNVGDCANENEAAANAEHYINCDGCTSGATGAQLDTATGSLYLTTTDANGNTSGIAGTTVSDWASPQGVSTNVNVSGGTSGDVSMSGYGVGLLAYFPYANLSLPPATIRDPNAPPALPKLKGKDKRLCLWGQMTNEMLGGEGGPSDSSDTAPGRGGAAAIPFHTTTRGGKPVTRQMGVSESGDSTMGGVQTLWDYGWAVAACLAN